MGKTGISHVDFPELHGDGLQTRLMARHLPGLGAGFGSSHLARYSSSLAGDMPGDALRHRRRLDRASVLAKVAVLGQVEHAVAVGVGLLKELGVGGALGGILDSVVAQGVELVHDQGTADVEVSLVEQGVAVLRALRLRQRARDGSLGGVLGQSGGDGIGSRLLGSVGNGDSHVGGGLASDFRRRRGVAGGRGVANGLLRRSQRGLGHGRRRNLGHVRALVGDGSQSGLGGRGGVHARRHGQTPVDEGSRGQSALAVLGQDGPDGARVQRDGQVTLLLGLAHA
mmetsp:Transcript_33176/g.70885  ORF Transcript_33176/g.70885 Transcript_33176/m.70885 type:complete len:283 (+) Transcript_33176:103-951(+)